MFPSELKKATVLLACGLLVFVVSLAHPGQVEKQKPVPKTDQEALQGTWIGESFECVAPNEAPPVPSLVRYTFEGTKLIVRIGKDKQEGSFELDPGKKPKHIDFTTKGHKFSDIYELKGDVLVICKGQEARKGREAQGRPNEFKAGQGPVITFRREGSKGASKFDAKTQETIDELFDLYKKAASEEEKERRENGLLQARAERAEREVEDATKYIAGSLKIIDTGKNCITVQIARTTFELKEIPIASDAKFFLDGKKCGIGDLKMTMSVQVLVESRDEKSHVVEIKAKTEVKKK